MSKKKTGRGLGALGSDMAMREARGRLYRVLASTMWKIRGSKAENVRTQNAGIITSHDSIVRVEN